MHSENNFLILWSLVYKCSVEVPFAGWNQVQRGRFTKKTSCDCFGWEEVVAHSLHQTLELVYKHLLTNQQMVAELEKVQHKPGVWEGTFFWRRPVSVSSLCAALYILIICLASSWWTSLLYKLQLTAAICWQPRESWGPACFWSNVCMQPGDIGVVQFKLWWGQSNHHI